MSSSADTRRLKPDTIFSPHGMVLCNGRFEILEPLSAGGMGTVHLARHTTLGATVAVKFLNPDLSPRAAKRFQREASLASQLHHPNLVRVIDYGDAPSPFLVMEYIQGPNMASLLRGGRRLKRRRIVNLMSQLCCGLQELHAHGIVHRDIKPANILLSPCTSMNGLRNERLKICDFGLARLIEEDPARPNLTAHGEICGTMLYISPEQALGRSVDGRADIYACGVLLYQMATGSLPFEADSDVGHLVKHAQLQPRPPSSVYPDISEDFEAIILRALHKDPGARYQNAHELCAALLELEPSCRKLIEALPWSIPSPEPPPAPPALSAGERATPLSTQELPESTSTPPISRAASSPGRTRLLLVLLIVTALLTGAAFIGFEDEARFSENEAYPPQQSQPADIGDSEARGPEAPLPSEPVTPRAASQGAQIGSAIAASPPAPSPRASRLSPLGDAMRVELSPAETEELREEASTRARRRKPRQGTRERREKTPRRAQTPPVLSGTISSRVLPASGVRIKAFRYEGSDSQAMRQAILRESHQIEPCWRALRTRERNTATLSLRVSFAEDGAAESLTLSSLKPLKPCIWSSLRHLQSADPDHTLQLKLTLQ